MNGEYQDNFLRDYAGATAASSARLPLQVTAAADRPIVGIIGAGQLARMCQPPAINLGIGLRLFAETDDAAASQVIVDTVVGDYTNAEQVVAWAQGCDVVTFDHEHVPASVLAALEQAGIPAYPPATALQYGQDKYVMRQKLSKMGIPVPAWVLVEDAAQAEEFIRAIANPAGEVIAKTPRGGYDGKGVQVITCADEITDWLAAGPVLIEELVAFRRELAVLIARSPSGKMAVWNVVETRQVGGVCDTVLAPAPELDPQLERQMCQDAAKIADHVRAVGVMAVECFEVLEQQESGKTQSSYVVNELALRPHNSGHWTQNGSATSQFEQHLRAVSDLPLGATTAVPGCTAMVNILAESGTGNRKELAAALTYPQAKVHWYGKGIRPGRKVGHVNVTALTMTDALQQAQKAAHILRSGADEALENR